MGALFSVGIKIIKFLLVFFLVQFFVSSTAYCVRFLYRNSEFSWVSFIISISMVAKIILSVMVFLYYKKVKSVNVIYSLSVTTMIDFLMPFILVVVFFYRKSINMILEVLSFLSLSKRKTNYIDEVSDEIHTIMISSSLSEFQKQILLFLVIYTILVLVIVVVLKIKINKRI